METKKFVKDYILSELTLTPKTNQLNILSKDEGTSENFGYASLQAGIYTVFYENNSSGTGMNFYIYDKNMQLIKTEQLTDNWITVVGTTLKQDEDGNFYLLGDMNPNESAGGTTYYSLILLNNIITDTPIIRKWYKLNKMGITYAHDVQKRVGRADYLFTYEQSRNVGSIVYDLYFVEFNINIQYGNSYIKWVYKAYSSYSSALDQLAQIGYLYNEESSKILVLRKKTNSIQLNLVNLDNDYETDTLNEISFGDGVEISKTLNETTHNLLNDKSILVNGISSFVFIRNSSNTLVQYNILDNFTTPKVVNVPVSNPVDYIFNNNYIGYVSGTPGDYTLTLYEYELTETSIIISNNYLSFTFDFEDDITQYLLNMNLINTKVYNLNYIVFILVEIAGNGHATIVTTDDGIDFYTDYNTLIPKYLNLYNDNILFSRELTNKSIIGNQMNAEINVPYSMLNNVSIKIEDLISETNNVETKTKLINKNIYESLYFNFIKHINVIDNNFNKNELQNEISSLLTKSIYDTKEIAQNNYNYTAPIWYAKLIKTDGTELIFSLGETAIEQISENEYLINIAVNGIGAEKLEILAKDKKTPYVTIPLHTVNKIILIKQKLKFDDTFIKYLVTENNEYLLTEEDKFIIME